MMPASLLSCRECNQQASNERKGMSLREIDSRRSTAASEEASFAHWKRQVMKLVSVVLHVIDNYSVLSFFIDMVV
jgi:hypothetical protein